MANFFASVLASRPLAEKRDGYKILTTLCGVAPHLAPERYGSHEPVRNEFDPSNLERPLESWESPPFLWKRSRPRVNGSIFPAIGKVRQHAVLVLHCENVKYASEAVTLIESWSLYARSDFAFVHLLTEKDIRTGMRAGVVSPLDRSLTRFTMLVTTHTLRRYIPDVYWLTIFGPAYVQHFGKSRLLSAPAPVVRELGPDLVCMQMSDDLNDMTTNASDVDGVRAQVKAHLGDGSFFSEALGPDHAYAAPQFRLESTHISALP